MDTCMPKIGAVGWRALLWHRHSDVCGKMASHTLTEAWLAQSGCTVLPWPVNYMAWTFSACSKQLKWIGYRKEALRPFHWQSQSHGVTLPFSNTSLVTWVKYALAKRNSTKLPTGYSHRNSHTATFCFTFRIFKMLVTLYQNQYVLLTSGDISPLALICLSNSKKKYFEVEKKKKSNSQESAGC